MTYSNETAAQISTTIVSQIGGRMALAMVGAKKSGSVLYDCQGTTTIKIKGSKAANTVKISLRGDDTYTVKISKITGGRLNRKTWEHSPIKEKIAYEADGHYAGDLRPLIERITGLYLSL